MQMGTSKKSTQEVQNSAKEAFDPHGPSRDKYWKELTVEEKVERMRINVKSMQHEVRTLQDDVETIFKHAHDKDGKLVIIMNKEDRYQLRQRVNALGTGLLTPNRGEDESFF